MSKENLPKVKTAWPRRSRLQGGEFPAGFRRRYTVSYSLPPRSEVQAQETMLGPHAPCQGAPGAPWAGRVPSSRCLSPRSAHPTCSRHRLRSQSRCRRPGCPQSDCLTLTTARPSLGTRELVPFRVLLKYAVRTRALEFSGHLVSMWWLGSGCPGKCGSSSSTRPSRRPGALQLVHPAPHRPQAVGWACDPPDTVPPLEKVPPSRPEPQSSLYLRSAPGPLPGAGREAPCRGCVAPLSCSPSPGDLSAPSEVSVTGAEVCF